MMVAARDWVASCAKAAVVRALGEVLHRSPRTAHRLAALLRAAWPGFVSA